MAFMRRRYCSASAFSSFALRLAYGVKRSAISPFNKQSYGTITPASRAPFFRVSGLPRGTAADVESRLVRNVRSQLSQEEQSLDFDISPIPSCYSTDDSPSSAALLRFRNGIPHFLMPLMADPLEEISIAIADGDKRSHISIDRHFHGFTQLYNVEPDNKTFADIIAISGMDAHAYGSWMTKEDGNIMWLRDFLSEDMPSCRTMIYGYQSKILTNHSSMLMDYGHEFFGELSKARSTDEEQRRPLFFVAHSYGGILVAHCLIRAFRASEKVKYSMYKATYGILFFGTPHQGSVKEALLKMIPVPDHPRRKLLNQISPDSEVLRMQLSDFKNVVGDRKVASFFETELTPEPELGPNGKWARTGPLRLQVDEASSVLQLADAMESKFPVHANHSNMVKFKSKNDSTYTTALRLLKEFERDAPQVVEQRYAVPIALPTPRFMVPFTVSSDFIGHPEILEPLGQIFDGSEYRRVAIIALGGIGKSSIAVQCAQAYKKRFPDAWVFWVHANTATRFRQSYLDIAKLLDLPGRHDHTIDVISLVAEYLTTAPFKWLMVLQSADDMEFLVNPQAEVADAAPLKPIMALIPTSPFGSVLVTSRDRKAAERIVGNYGPVIPVPPLSDYKAIELLRTRSRDIQSSEKDARTLTKLLGNVPLAISQAGAYISRNHPRLTISQYLSFFLKGKNNQATLLAKESQDHSGSDQGVFTTWAISFERIRVESPNSARILAIMSFLDSKEIPDSIFTKNMPEYRAWDLRFEDDITPLLDLSLISAEVGGCSFDVHRLLQLAMRQWLASHGGLDTSREAAIQLVLKALPKPAAQFQDWELCKKIIPHAEAVLQYFPKSHDVHSASDEATLLFRIAHHAWLKGDFKTAFDKCVMAKEIFTRHLDANDPVVLETQTLISSILSSMDRRDLAIRFQKAALERRAISFGPTHVDSRASLQITADISRLLAEDGQLDEAERLAQDALKGLQAYNRPAGPGTIKAMRTLAFVRRSRGQIGKSEAILQKILKLQEEHCGTEHINTLLTVGELADLHMQCHEYHQAIPLYTRALTCLEMAFGKDHHITQDLHNRLNAALQRNQRWWWSMLRIIFTGFRIPLRLVSHLKSIIARLVRTLKSRIQEVKDRNLHEFQGGLYVRFKIIKNALMGLVFSSACYMGANQR